MEKMREEENRGGQPHNNSAGGGRGKDEIPLGFEGMNFEQKRKPYRSVIRSNKESGHPENRDHPGKRRENL